MLVSEKYKYANIVHAVKKCYKRKIDSGVFGGVFWYVTEVADAVFFVQKGFLAIQMEYFWKARKPFLHCKTTTIAMQMRLF